MLQRSFNVLKITGNFDNFIFSSSFFYFLCCHFVFFFYRFLIVSFHMLVFFVHHKFLSLKTRSSFRSQCFIFSNFRVNTLLNVKFIILIHHTPDYFLHQFQIIFPFLHFNTLVFWFALGFKSSLCYCLLNIFHFSYRLSFWHLFQNFSFRNLLKYFILNS